jgi:phosphoribosyl 1,2-cyclic phosphate phosphodiesterase
MKLTFLGTGTSFGVPQLGCHCAVCTSADPRDRRTRCGAVIETDDGVRLLIDSPPELRLQLIAAGIDDVDAVLFTHDHADHTHGIDDLRAITVQRNRPLPMYGSPETIESISAKFSYIFDEQARPMPGTSRPEGRLVSVAHGRAFSVAGTEILPLQVPHGHLPVLGYRVGPVAYITDAKSIPDETIAMLAGVRVLVLNALFWTEHPTHLSFPEAIGVARAVGAEHTFLTHLTHHSMHARLEAELPPGVAPAFDGLTIIA